MSTPRHRSANRRARTDRFAPAWHVAWLAAVGGVAGALYLSETLTGGPALIALAEVAGAALLGALLTGMGGAGPAMAILVWALAAGAAAQMTGGASGPLAAWCLIPLAAAAACRRPGLLALGAAASVGAAAVAALGSIFLPQPPVAAALAPWFALLALSTTTLGAAAAVLSLMGRLRGELKRLSEAENVMADALDHQPQLLMTVEPDGRVRAAFGPDLAGVPAADLVGGAFSDIAAAPARPALDAALHSAAEHGAADVFFTPAADPEGSYELVLRRVPGGRLAAAVRDARVQRDREVELERARVEAEQANAGKSRFLANMSHELRTPLNAIMGFSDVMRQRFFGPLGDRYAEYAELIHESGSHLLELINDVLDMSKIEAERYDLHLELFDAREAVQAVLRLMRGQAERAGVQLRAVLPVEALEATADRRAVKQIALNLVSNALKFTPRGGSVTVTVRGVGEVLELAVSDTGVGIAPDDLERLGTPYEQAGDGEQRAAGTGLGLSLVQAFARLHGGEMSMESALGEGTTVTVRLPVLGEQQAPKFRPAREA